MRVAQSAFSHEVSPGALKASMSGRLRAKVERSLEVVSFYGLAVTK
jgi:hypothetical protein